jgi:hypothetical protein
MALAGIHQYVSVSTFAFSLSDVVPVEGVVIICM